MLAKGSSPWIIITIGFTICLMIIYNITHSKYIGAGVFICLISLLFFLVFFRDPERHPPKGEEYMISPADGKIVDIRNRKICIFMNFQNVHVNRCPLNGKVVELKYKKGGFIPAYHKDSYRNERQHIYIETEHGKIEVTQIAGTVIRRIVPYVKVGDNILKGQRLGMIRFGSRVDVTIPDSFTIECKIGDKVYAGKSQIAKLKSKE